MTMVDLVFPVVGNRLPSDHNYLLLSAVCRVLPSLHDGSVSFGLAPITGLYVGQGTLQVDPGRSHFFLRLAAPDLPKALPLAGKTLTLCGRPVCVGAPRVQVLQPAPALHARTVTIKNATELDTFLTVARRELDRLGIGGRLVVPQRINQDGQWEARRHVLRIKDKHIICFSLLVQELTANESMSLQAIGLGGRRHMGGGIFLPTKPGRGDT